MCWSRARVFSSALASAHRPTFRFELWWRSRDQDEPWLRNSFWADLYHAWNEWASGTFEVSDFGGRQVVHFGPP